MKHLLFLTTWLWANSLLGASPASDMQQYIPGNPRITLQDPHAGSEVKQWLDSLVIDGKRAVFDEKGQCFYQTVSESYRDDRQYEAGCKAYLKDSVSVEVRVNGVPLGEHFSFAHFSHGTRFQISLHQKESGQMLAEAGLQFTFLPLVEITGQGFNNSDYREGTFRVTDADAPGGSSFYRAKFRHRGATASTKRKKAYAVKLTDESGKSLDASFFGLRSDNNWILDAMAIDPARMRNRVTTDLWNDFATLPYHFQEEPEAHNGTRGRFVEVFLNGSYHGLYCMTEKMDRKQLKLKKIQESDNAGVPATIRGALYKSSQWSYSVFMGHDENSSYFPMAPVAPFDNSSETWDNWEMKYPDVEDGEPINWGALADAINLVAAGSEDEFRNRVEEQFDLPVFLDYYLLIELILATDNHGKNMFLHHYNQQESSKISMSPWDLDGTWGRRWDGSDYTRDHASDDFVAYLWAHEHGEHTLFKRLMQYNVNDWNRHLAARYAALRKTYFDENRLYRRFERYADLFRDSGADRREVDRWDGSDHIYLNFDRELEYLASWIHERLQALDRQYHYDPDATGMASPNALPSLTVTGSEGCMMLHLYQSQKVRIYRPDGVLQQEIHLDEGVHRLPVSRPGMYLVNGQKVMVR